MTKEYLTTVPDTEKMTREFFSNLIRKFRHHRNISFGFSKKHTEDIMEYRRQIGVTGSTMPSNVYTIPVEWNAEVTYVR